MTRKSGRDESIEHLLKDSLQEPWQTPASGFCPDAEILAAWTDGVLEGRELAMTREHVANCVSCQATLAVLARTAPPEPAPVPWWPRVPSIRWVVPVAATATALAIWVAVPREEYTPPERPTAIASDSGLPQPESVQPPAQPQAALEGSADRAAAAPGPAAPSTGELLFDTLRKESERQDSGPPAREEAAAAAPAPTADTGAGALARQEAVAPSDAPPAPVSQPAAPAPAQAARLGTTRGAIASLAAQPTVVVSPGTMLRWRLGRAGSVDYSTDAGRTWGARPTGVDVDLIAGASPAANVCWIVGRTGTVLLTVNGMDWRRVTSPTTLDLVAVEATDARTALVTAASGARFSTTDGGITWQTI